MGKQVTYGIGYTRADPIQEGYKYYINEYKEYLASHKKIKAAKVAIQLSTWLAEEGDEVDDPEDTTFQQYLQVAIKHCKLAVTTLESTIDEHLLPKAHKSIGQCYLILNKYELAVKHSLLAIQFMEKQRDQPNDIDDPMDIDQPIKPKLFLQSAYKLLGTIYFTKSLDSKASRYQDFTLAHQYYQREREIIDTMTAEDIDEEQGSLQILSQSSYFNMGVMEAKMPWMHEDAESNLKRALALAMDLRDHVSEKTAWWELGNLYKRTGQFDLVKGCQQKEFELIKLYEFTDDLMFCVQERMKFLLFLGEYNTCAHLYKENIDEADPEISHIYKQTFQMVKRVKAEKEKLDSLALRGDHNASIAALFLAFIKLLESYELYRMIVNTVDNSMKLLLDARDFSPLIYAQILQLKTEALWKLSESQKEEYLKSSNETLEYIQASLVDAPLDQLKLTCQVLELRVRMHEYFDQEFQMKSCKSILVEVMKEEQLMRQKLENSFVEDIQDHSRITPAVHKRALQKNVRVKVLTQEPIELRIHYDYAPETVQKLMNDVSSRCWVNHGVEPVLSHMRTLDHDIYPEDHIRNIITQDDQYIEAYVKSIVKKPPLNIYTNACERLKLEPTRYMRQRLTSQSLTKLCLDRQNIASGQMILVEQVLQHSTSLQVLNLASNMLSDSDISSLLKVVNKGLSELDLSNNLVSAAILSSLTGFRLRILNLSHNPLGPLMFEKLPAFLDLIPSLKHLLLENTDIGKVFVINDRTRQVYIDQGKKVSQAAGLIINLASNHFENDMLAQWTALWIHLKRVSGLELASITSDFDWKNFDTLSDLPRLSDLSFRYSMKRTFDYCRFQPFFTRKPNLHHIDFTGCGLTLDDMINLTFCLDSMTKLRKLTLDSNPQIGDDGVQFLNGIIEKSKLDILDLSDCGLTNKSTMLIIRWARYLKQLNVTKNPSLSFDNEMQNTLTSQDSSMSTLIKVDDTKGIVKSSQIRPTYGLAYQPASRLPNSPF